MRSARVVPIGLAVVLAACDPVHRIDVSRDLSAPLSEQCILQALRSADEVRLVDVSEAGVVFVGVEVPPTFEGRESQLHFEVHEELNDGSDHLLVFSAVWLGPDVSQEYREFAEQTMQDLQDLVIGRCSSESGE